MLTSSCTSALCHVQVWQELSELLLFLLPLLNVTQLRRGLLRYLPRITATSTAGGTSSCVAVAWCTCRSDVGRPDASCPIGRVVVQQAESFAHRRRGRHGGSRQRSQSGVRSLLVRRDAAAVRRRALWAPVLLLLPAQPHRGRQAVRVPPVPAAGGSNEACLQTIEQVVCGRAVML